MMIAYPESRTDSSVSTENWRGFFLDRLDRLVHLECDPDRSFNAKSLLQHAIFATYVDCRELGLADDAREILSRAERSRAAGR